MPPSQLSNIPFISTKFLRDTEMGGIVILGSNTSTSLSIMDSSLILGSLYVIDNTMGSMAMG
jgi:hypothetical protein